MANQIIEVYKLGPQGPAGEGGGGAVDSVAGKTGVVTLVKADVGLSLVDNTSDAGKPVSTAQTTALNLKVDKVAGSGLITSADQTKLDGIAAGAQVNVIASDAPSDGTPYSRQDGGWVAGGGTSWTLTFAQVGVLSPGDMWMADVSAQARTRALPLTPDVDDEVVVKDDLGNANNFTITVAPNGNPIMGVVENFTISTVFASVRFKWSGSDWRIVS